MCSGFNLFSFLLSRVQIIYSAEACICYHRQIDRDCELLEQEGIMDYSLLVGIHFKDISVDGDLIPSGSHTPAGTFLISTLQY